MNPQPVVNTAQLRHAAENGQKVVDAKKLEIQAYKAFLDVAKAATENFFGDNRESRAMADVITMLLQSKIARGAIELEESELQLKSVQEYLRQAESLIQVPNLQPNQRH